MRTVGTLLKEERQKKGFTLEQVEKATKIRAKFLVAIENEDYKKLPSLPYVQGFIKNYSTFLGLRSTTILAIFRREYIQKEKQQQEQIEEPLSGRPWQITPTKVILVVLICSVLGLLAYFFLQYRALHAPPPLTIEGPQNDAVVQTEEIAVFGKTDPDATVTINNEPVLLKEKGKFYKDILVTLGVNTITIESTSRVGEKSHAIRTVTRVP